jgi:hypothetical protein
MCRDSHTARLFPGGRKLLEQTKFVLGYVARTLRSSRAEQRGDNMTASGRPNAEERRRAKRHKVARRLYEALLAQDPNRAITLCDEAGKVVARHDPLPEHDAPEIASLIQGPTANGHEY